MGYRVKGLYRIAKLGLIEAGMDEEGAIAYSSDRDRPFQIHRDR